MPTNAETVPNRPLSGHELKEVLRQDFERMLSGDGFLNSQIAFGRVGYEIQYKLHMDNPTYPTSTVVRSSRRSSDQELKARPELHAIEPGPKLTNPSEESIVRGQKLEHKVTSPNHTRVERGLPVTIQTRNQDRSVTERQVTYDPTNLPEGERPVVIDTSEQVAEEMGIPAAAAPSDIGGVSAEEIEKLANEEPEVFAGPPSVPEPPAEPVQPPTSSAPPAPPTRTPRGPSKVAAATDIKTQPPVRKVEQRKREQPVGKKGKKKH